MMVKKSVASVIFDSVQMTLSVVSDKGGFGCLEYASNNVYTGVSKNFFVSPNEIEGLIVDLMNRYTSFSGKRLSSLQLVLPQHFFLLQTTVVSRPVNGKVTDKDVALLKKSSPTPPSGYVLISQKSGGYSVDGQGDFSFDVVGKDGVSCQMLVAATYLDEKVFELFGNISKNIRIDFTFIAPSTPMVDKLSSEGVKRGLILKINQLSSNLIYFEEDLAVSALGLSFGSFHFSDVLSQKFDVDFETGNKLLSHVNLGLAINNDKYVLFTKDGKRSFSVKDTNEILTEAVDYWASETRSAVKGLIGEDDLPLYMTGSSVVLTQGFAELLSEKTGLKVYSLAPDLSYWNVPEEYVGCALYEKY